MRALFDRVPLTMALSSPGGRHRSYRDEQVERLWGRAVYGAALALSAHDHEHDAQTP